MADTKISALPASTVPLAGTEVLPIVQSSSTKQVSVANLTAGRSFSALGMTLTSTDADAAAAPIIDLYRDSASPASSDTLGEIEFNGEDSAGNKQAYGLIHASILSPTSGSEQGQLHFETATAGALTEKMIIGTTNLVINEIGAVFNVRIEGDTDANLLYTDATNDRIGVGTISPSVKFEVNGATKASSLSLTTPLPTASGGTALSSFTANGVVYASSTSALATGSGLTFDGNNLLVGTTNNAFGSRLCVQGTAGTSTPDITVGIPLNASGNTNFTIYRSAATNGYAGIEAYQAGVGGANLVVNSINGGNVLIGYTSSNGSYKLQVNSQIFATSAIIATSDKNYKTNVTPISNGLSLVNKLNPIFFKWKKHAVHNFDIENTQIGFLAQDIQETLKDEEYLNSVIYKNKTELPDGSKEEFLGLADNALIPILVKAIQEQQGIIESLTERLTALENK
jgi:hypothetical protein